jgi:hypothetical protein
MSRRRFVLGVALGPVALRVALPRAAWARAGAPLRTLTAHEGTVVEAATARLIPGPTDDPLEAGHPGAREANVVGYIDALLSAFDDDPPHIYAGGPFSGRHGGDGDDFVDFVPLTPLQERHWRPLIADLQDRYRAGVAALDAAAGGDFASASPSDQDQVLIDDATGFRDLLFDHAIEGWLAAPEYGGNADGSGWTEIGFLGDVCPDGFTPDEVSTGDGPDPVDPTGAVGALIGLVGPVFGGGG